MMQVDVVGHGTGTARGISRGMTRGTVTVFHVILTRSLASPTHCTYARKKNNTKMQQPH